jgi:hypothetical protein
VSASYSIGRMLSGVRSAARKKLFRSEPADLLGISWSPDSPPSNGTDGGHHHHWWTALENNFVLESSEDEYGGVVVDADRLPSDKAAFARSLAASLSYWKSVVRTGGQHLDLSDRIEQMLSSVPHQFISMWIHDGGKCFTAAEHTSPITLLL